MTQSEFNSLRKWNDISWAALALGAAGIGGSYLIREDQAATGQKQGPKGHWYAGISPTGVAVGGSL